MTKQMTDEEKQLAKKDVELMHIMINDIQVRRDMTKARCTARMLIK